MNEEMIENSKAPHPDYLYVVACKESLDIEGWQPNRAVWSDLCDVALNSLSAYNPNERLIEETITAWAYAHDIDGAARNDLFARLRSSSEHPNQSRQAKPV